MADKLDICDKWRCNRGAFHNGNSSNIVSWAQQNVGVKMIYDFNTYQVGKFNIRFVRTSSVDKRCHSFGKERFVYRRWEITKNARYIWSFVSKRKAFQFCKRSMKHEQV